MLPHIGGIVQRAVVQFFHKHRIMLLEQRLKQCFLIGKMPIQRTARHPRLLRNFLQCGAGNAHAPENFQSGIQQVLACFLCFLFGFSHKRPFVLDGIDILTIKCENIMENRLTTFINVCIIPHFPLFSIVSRFLYKSSLHPVKGRFIIWQHRNPGVTQPLQPPHCSP